jgi:hypothetical protein
MDIQLSISSTQRITHDAITGVVLLSSSGRRRWIASWYSERLSDWDFSFCFRSICLADSARMEYRRCGADFAICGNVEAKCRWLSNMSSYA